MPIIQDRIYWAWDRDLGIGSKNSYGAGHRVITVKVGKNTSLVKTITSLEKYSASRKRYEYDNKRLNKAKKGQILPIPKRILNSEHYSGINNKVIEIENSKLYNPKPNPKNNKFYRFPSSYANLIRKKQK